MGERNIQCSLYSCDGKRVCQRACRAAKEMSLYRLVLEKKKSGDRVSTWDLQWDEVEWILDNYNYSQGGEGSLRPIVFVWTEREGNGPRKTRTHYDQTFVRNFTDATMRAVERIRGRRALAATRRIGGWMLRNPWMVVCVCAGDKDALTGLLRMCEARKRDYQIRLVDLFREEGESANGTDCTVLAVG